MTGLKPVEGEGRMEGEKAESATDAEPEAAMGRWA